MDKNILIVDDISVNRLLLRCILNALGYSNIDEAINGSNALEMAIDNKYDIIFMDIQMPVMDGFISTYKIRQALNDKPIIIAVTAYYDKIPDDSGFNVCIRKPYTIDSIADILKKYNI